MTEKNNQKNNNIKSNNYKFVWASFLTFFNNYDLF